MSTPAIAPLRRTPDAGMVAGICSMLGARLGIDPIFLRLGFVLGATAGGAGVLVYLVIWAAIPAACDRAQDPRVARRPAGDGSWQITAGLVLLVLSALLFLRALGVWIADALAWPLVLAGTGAVVMWRRVVAERFAPLTAAARGRALLGAALVIGGGLVFLWLNDALAPARDVVLAAVVVLAASALILAPWWLRLARGLAAERAERIRSQERAEVAAHLHDSVLQTLALMQHRAEDPRAVATLARRQERELRAWLNGDPPPGEGDTLTAALERAALEIEDAHGVAIDVVAVGDCRLDARVEAVVAAAREAMLNAAKFAGEFGAVSVYTEASGDRLQVFVRDRGPGYDLAAVPEDRRGVRESIVGRMERHGGRAVVRSGGEGTEVELTVERAR